MRYLLVLLLLAPFGCTDGEVVSDSLLTTGTPTADTPQPITFMGFRTTDSYVSAWANDLPLVTEDGSLLTVPTQQGSGAHGRYIGIGTYSFAFHTSDDQLDSQVDSSIVVGEGNAAAVALLDGDDGPTALAFVHDRPVGLPADQLALKFVNVRNDRAAMDLYQCATRSNDPGDKAADCTVIASDLAFAQPWQQVLTIDGDTQFAVEGPEGFERLPMTPRQSPNGPPEPSFAAVYYHEVYGVQFYQDDPEPF